mmetsp:Transcript_2124/g.4945  ORF Transcript_2124/g.4945 Transcript_2124/m.4945 type:complete len:102 (-) Transcript_2124:86-391(-)|eukprot:CAMPEP_0198341034 /NCGR_PEP_ID=MMETSP1450-20131203/46101_1 /TAXON_ID=753684 ORGANISM="Madagascaria erythrocladiodes, Strain CCMP3234" /NCGR_SAMPLE_ID=MMETSP1450 /ASSEMBLY_ACC=CAM_ASM_001115 /LENGTH=101 /DNA_ID=CAMNT_0044046031 /DNA_START=64 /DNA_END=369 /DNA_ORIENTATION=-
MPSCPRITCGIGRNADGKLTFLSSTPWDWVRILASFLMLYSFLVAFFGLLMILSLYLLYLDQPIGECSPLRGWQINSVCFSMYDVITPEQRDEAIRAARLW